jgi:hypothetical protein
MPDIMAMVFEFIELELTDDLNGVFASQYNYQWRLTGWCFSGIGLIEYKKMEGLFYARTFL